MTGSNETEINPSQPLGGTDRLIIKHIFTIWLITSCKHLRFFSVWMKNSKLAYFFLYRLFMKRFFINRYKQTDNRTDDACNLKNARKKKKEKPRTRKNEKKVLLRHHKRTLSNAIIVPCTSIRVKEQTWTVPSSCTFFSLFSLLVCLIP